MHSGTTATMISKQCGGGGVNSSSGGASRSPPRSFLQVTYLPAPPLDKVFEYLEDEDLRRFHQVSKDWKAALESRAKENRRRLELVRGIRENKENINIRNGPLTPQEPAPLAMAQRAIRERSSLDIMDGKKMGNSFILMECTNQVVDTPPTSVINSSNVSTPASAIHFLTPTSHFEFQEFQKAEQSLEEGQKLLQCRKCRGPVPSPVTPGVTSQESRRLSSQSTRCRLISRLDDDYNKHSQPESPQKRECKKAKTLSTADLSPIPYTSSAAVTNLGEQMSQSLFVSSPCLTTSSSSGVTYLPPSSSPGSNTVKRSTSCSSITGIDVPHQVGEIGSPIELSVNISLDNSSFLASNPTSHHLHHTYGTFSVDLNGSSLNCSRSCCSPRHVSQLHISHFSDSGLSFEGESVEEFSNMVLSPDVPAVVSSKFVEHNNNSRSNRNSIERVRDFSSYSDGALSLSSFSHLQRSDHSLNFSNFDNNNESIFADVLECPNPKCGYRFCSNCEEREHPGRSCHILSSDQFEPFSFECNNNNISNSFGGSLDANRNSVTSNINSSNSSSRDNINSNSNNNNNKSSSNKKNISSTSGKNSKHKNQKKTPLRRLARL